MRKLLPYAALGVLCYFAPDAECRLAALSVGGFTCCLLSFLAPVARRR